MGNYDGKVIISTALDNAELEKDLEGLPSNFEESTSGISGLTDKLKTGLETAAKVGMAAISAASAGIAALMKASIDGYAEYEQLAGGVETLFESSSDIVMGYAENAYKTAGLSANEYMETVTSFSASLLQSLGNDTAAAAEKADLAITDMADNANKMGTDMESIQNAYQGFAKQNYTMLDNLKLGYGGTKEEMERLLEDAEKLSGVEYDISSYADIVDAIHVVQTEMGITGTTAKEASSTIQGSISSMKSAWQNFLTGMADPNQDFNTLLDNLVDSVVTVGENIIPRIQATLPRLAEGLTQLIQGLLPYIPETLQTLLPTLIEGATGLINGFTTVLPGIITEAVQTIPQLVDAAVSIVGNLVSALIEAAPQILDAGMQLLDNFVSGLEDGLPDMISRLPQIMDGFLGYITENLPDILDKGAEMLNNLVNGIIGAIPDLLEALPQVITSFTNFVANNLPKIVESGIKILSNLVSGMIQSIPELVKALPQIITAIVNGIGALMASVVDIGKNIVKGIWQGIQNMTSWIKDKVTGFFSGIVDGVKGLLGIASPSKVFAGIGSYMMQGLAQGVDKGAQLAVRSTEAAINAVERAAALVQLPSIALPTVSIPALATGAVIPPNRQFMAVLGDQTSGNNIEAPESLIRKIVREEAGGSNTELLQDILEAIRAGQVIKVNETVLGRTSAKAINKLTQSSGKPVLLW